MDILTYLIELLQQSNAVGLTGFGTFHKKKFPGRYDKEKQSFIPPGFTLEFTTEVKEHQKLSAFISRKRNLSEGSTNYYIAQFVEETNKQLETEHEVNLEGLGRLFFTEHNGLSFEPAEGVNYGSQFYGLPNLSEPKQETKAPDTNSPSASPLEEQPAAEPTTDHIIEASPEQITSPLPVETVELDEVKDDIRNTLTASAEKETRPETDTQPIETAVPDAVPENEQIHKPAVQEEIPVKTTPITEAPEFIQEQHTEHPNRFGHQPEVEKTPVPKEDPTSIIPPVVDEPVVEAPEFIKEQHSEHPNRFGHQPEAETEKTYIPLEQPLVVVQSAGENTIVEAPEFIKEQHAEHPNRFGHDPLLDEYEERKAPLWPKNLFVLLILIILAALLYYFKPGLFTGNAGQNTQTTAVTDSTITPEDTLGTIRTTSLSKQDSIAKTDSILRANQVQGNADTLKKATPVPVQTVKPKPAAQPVVADDSPKPEITSFEIIGASFETVKGAESFIKQARAKGIKARIVKIHGPRKHVSLGSFQSEKEARDQLSILEKKLDGEGFYVQQLINTTP